MAGKAKKESNKINIDKNDIKNETKKTVDSVKDTIKTVNIKDDTKTTSNFVIELFKDPLGVIKKLGSDSTNKAFKYALIIAIVWLAAVLINSLFNRFRYTTFPSFGVDLLGVIKDLLAPAIGVVTLSATLYALQKGSKKSMPIILTTVITGAIPIILVEILDILTIIGSGMHTIISPIGHFAVLLTAVYEYFVMKSILKIDDDKQAIMKYMIVQAVYFGVYFVIHFMGIYIPMI